MFVNNIYLFFCLCLYRTDIPLTKYLFAAAARETLGSLAAAFYLHSGRAASSLLAGAAERTFWAQHVPPAGAAAASTPAAAAAAAAAAGMEGFSFTMGRDSAVLAANHRMPQPTEKEKEESFLVALQRLGKQQQQQQQQEQQQQQ